MTLHDAVLADLLDGEVAASRLRFVDLPIEIERDCRKVLVTMHNTNVGVAVMELDGESYDSEPFRVRIVDSEGSTASQDMWPQGLVHSIHPILHRPFVCIQGTYEYHSYPGHLADRWDACRGRIRLPNLLAHLIRKAGL